MKDSNLYLLNLVGQTALAEIPIPMTFVDGILTVTLPVDKNTTQMFGVAKLTDGTLLFELVQGDTTMDFLMEAVPEDGNVFRPCTFFGGNCYTFDAIVARKHE